MFSTARLAGMFSEQKKTDRFMLWIDGVGAWLLCLNDRFTIGGPVSKTDAADLRLMANLSKQHVAIYRDSEDYFVDPLGATRLNNVSITESTPLRSKQTITAGENVRLGFSQPTALSASAVIDFKSVHRPARALDGVVMMHETVLLGPGSENHVRCPDWSTSVVLFRRNENELWCRSREQIAVDGKPLNDIARINPGAIVTGEDLSFRVEPVLPDS